MSLLETYVWNTMKAKGLRHKIMLDALRNYLRTSRPEDIIFQINRITRIDELRTLWEAGLREPIRSAVLRRLEELERRRT